MPRTKVDAKDSAAQKNAKKETTQGNKAPKDINGEISKENELDAVESNTRKSGRKRAADSNDIKEDRNVKVKKTVVGNEPAPPKKEKKPRTNKATESKVKPSKADGQPIEIEKKHPGGDMVETEILPKSKALGETLDKSLDKTSSKQEKKKGREQKANQKASKDDVSTKETVPSKKSKAKPPPKSEQPKTQDEKTLSLAPEQAMDQTPFKALVAREKAKIPAVKASADAAEAAREEMAASNADSSAIVDGKEKSAAKPKVKQNKTPVEAPVGSELGDESSKAEAGKPARKKKEKQTKSLANASVDLEKGQPSKAKKSKTTPKATAKIDEMALEDTLAVEPKVAPQKGQKRKASQASEAPVPDSASGKKKQKKSRPSVFEAATDVVGSLVTSGVEAAKELASGLSSKSIADDVTGVAEDVVNAKREAAKEAKKNSKKNERATEDDLTDDGADADDAEEDDQTAALIKGFGSDSDDAEMDDDKGYQDGHELPKVPKNKDVDKKLKVIKDVSDGPGVIYVG